MGWNTYNASTPAFVADWESIDRNTGRQIDWSRVPESYKNGTKYTIQANGAANAAATSITVDALPVDLPVGTVLNWTGAGEFSILTAPALKGATTLAVEALDAGIEDDDQATFLVTTSNSKSIVAGTVMCQLSGGKIVPRAARPGSETAIGLLLTNANEANRSEAKTGYGVIVGGVIYETLLPETITSYKTELDAAGTAFSWQTYADNR